MNRNRIFTGVIIVATTAMTIVACKRSSIQHPSIEGEITVNTSIAGGAQGVRSSRSVVSGAADLEGIQFLHKNDPSPDRTTYDFTDVLPVSGTRSAGVSAPIKFSTPPTYEMDNAYNAYMVGYYPAGELDEATDVVTWTPDGGTDILYTELWNGGTFRTPKSDGMEFLHATSRLELILAAKSGTTPSELSLVWGAVSSVTVDDMPTTLTYSYATGVRQAGATMAPASLLNGSSYNVDETTSGVIGANGNTDVKFGAMLVPVARKSMILKLSTERRGVITLGVTLSKDFDAGKIHTITVEFGVNDKDVSIGLSTIRDWDLAGGLVDEEIKLGEIASVNIDGVLWAKGNLVATSSTSPGSGVPTNTNGSMVTVGLPTDGGLYFQFGSLIGYKGGNVASNGTGRGIPHGATTTDPMPDIKWWSQATAYSWANDAMVWPQVYTNGAATWPQGLTDNSFYFGLGADPYDKMGQKLSAFPDWESGGLVTQSNAVGDPCRYYLGGGWRMPTAEDWGKLFNSRYANGPVGGIWPGAGENWGYGTGTKTVMAGVEASSNSPTEGKGIYANTAATTEADAKADPGALFFPASGYRNTSNGSFYNVGREGYYRSGSVYNATFGFALYFGPTSVSPQNGSSRSNGFPVRCVSSVALSSDKAENTAPKEAGSFTVTVLGTNDENWTLVETGDASAAFTPSATSGTGDGTFTVTVTENATANPREASYTLSTASGLTATITLKQDMFIPQSILIDGLKWATGNLVADASVAPGSGVATGTKGTKVIIGKPTDGGVYFQFGSLIGYKGGNTASLGRGTGIPHGATTTDPMPDTKYWSQAAAYSWANDAMVWPQAYTATAATWPKTLTENTYYFGLGADPYDKMGQKLSAYANWESGGSVTPSIAVGDPCRYYLGGGWRMPTAEDWGKLFNSVYANGPVGGAWPGADKDWGYGTATKTYNTGMTGSNNATEGVGIYANTTATTEAAAKADPGALFFPASGRRNTSDGSFYNVGREGYYWSGSVSDATYGFALYFGPTSVSPRKSTSRPYGFLVRCVSSVALSSDKAENTAPKEAGSFTLTVAGTDGEGWTLAETADASAAFTPSKTSGTGDGTFTVAVTANATENPREASYTLTTASGLTATITLKQKRVMPANAIEAGGLFWAKGNLVVDASVTPGSGVATGTNGTKVKIGAPTDGGLYFQFGSLIGYKGGNAASKGTGRGIPHGATTTAPMPNYKWWNQAAAYSWANDAMVWPQAYTNGAATWPKDLFGNSYYFGLDLYPYNKMGPKLSAFPDWESGGLVTADIAVGDPCRYYLGGAWRMPTAEDWGKLFNSVYANGPVGGAWPGAGRNWGYGTATKTVMAGITGSNSATEGIGLYANTTATNLAAAKADPGALFFPASGYRTSGGSFYLVGNSGYYWSGSGSDAISGVYLNFGTTSVYPQNSYDRSNGFPVRCVSEP